MGAAAGGSAYWHYGLDDGYGILRPDGAPKEALLDAIVRPAPERVAGTPVSFALDGETGVFTLTYRADLEATAPTTVSVPERVYPRGYSVECDGCASEQAPGRLTILAPPAGDPATVVLRPLP